MLPEAAKLLNRTDRDELDREDLVMFINTCYAATSQHEYYNEGLTQSISVEFLHEYVLHNFRRLYALCLGLSINHYNQQAIILNLLSAGAPENGQLRQEEGRMIALALQRMPANRAFHVLEQLSRRRINNRRSRAIARDYLAQRRDKPFDVVKYRKRYRAIVRHTHIDVGIETANVLFALQRQSCYQTPLYETFRQAHYAKTAVFQLPFSIAQGLAVRHAIPQEEFLRRIAAKMTPHEKLRMQNAAKRESARLTAEYSELAVDFKTVGLTRLLLYILSLPMQVRLTQAQQLQQYLQHATDRALKGYQLQPRRVAAVLDCSRSARGSRQKFNRPLAVTLGCYYLLERCSEQFKAFWTPTASCDLSCQYPFVREAQGQTALADPLIDAMEWGADLVVIVSDGHENDPPAAANSVVATARRAIPSVVGTQFVHANPVFDAQHFSPRPLGSAVSTVGLRDAEDLPIMLRFSAFVSGQLSYHQLQAWLSDQAKTSALQ